MSFELIPQMTKYNEFKHCHSCELVNSKQKITILQLELIDTYQAVKY